MGIDSILGNAIGRAMNNTVNLYDGQIKPKKSSYGGYVSPYVQQIQDLTNKIQNRPSFSYDLNSDPIAQQGIKDAVNSVSRIAAGKNMLYSESNKNHMNQAALDQGQQFQNAAYNRYQNEGSNLYDQLQALSNLENQNYGQYRDNVNRQDQVNQQLGYVNPFAGQEVNPVTNQFAGNYQAEINRRRATPDTADDALIPDLQAAQASKVFSDPALLQKYGKQLGYMTRAAQQQQYDNSRATNQDKFNNDVTLAGLTGMYNGKPTMAYDQQQAAIKNQANGNAAQWANIGNDSARIAWEQDLKNNPDNLYKIAQINSANNKSNIDTKTGFTVDDFANAIEKQFAKKDFNGNISGYDTNSILKYIQSLEASGVDSKITDNLAMRYGLKIG